MGGTGPAGIRVAFFTTASSPAALNDISDSQLDRVPCLSALFLLAANALVTGSNAMHAMADRLALCALKNFEDMLVLYCAGELAGFIVES